MPAETSTNYDAVLIEMKSALYDVHRCVLICANDPVTDIDVMDLAAARFRARECLRRALAQMEG